MTLRTTLLFVAAITSAAAAQAQQVRSKEIHITRAEARATAPAQKTGAAYLTIENRGTSGDRLIRAFSPVAASVEIHTMAMNGNMMRMREIGSIDLPAAQKIEMRPGEGYHLMLMGLSQSLKQGEKFPLTLEFEKAGKVEVSVQVEAIQASSAQHGHQH